MAWILGLSAIVIIAAAITAVVVLSQGGDGGDEPASNPTPSASETATPSPTPEGPAANAGEFDAEDYPVANVFGIHPDLPVDDAPDEKTLGLSAAPASGDGAPVFADPEDDEPVAWLSQEERYGGTVVPVVEQHDAWVRVLLVGRQALPGQGDASQLTGWLRTADVEIDENEMSVEVDLSAQTIEVVDGTGSDAERETIATEFAWGAAATPTPTGRSFVMLTEVTSLDYARGHPIVYLSEQSQTLAGFDGQDVAVTAFHYHDVRAGSISNGCLRVDEAAITRLAELPAGTPIYIS